MFQFFDVNSSTNLFTSIKPLIIAKSVIYKLVRLEKEGDFFLGGFLAVAAVDEIKVRSAV